MIVRVREFYLARTRREQRLMLLMVVIAVPLLAWLLIVRPITNWYEAALRDQLIAVDRHGRVLALAGAAKGSGPRSTTAGGDLQLLVTESARDAGLTLQSASPAGSDSIDVSASGAAVGAFASWLRSMEARGIATERMSLTPAADGSAILSARLVRR